MLVKNILQSIWRLKKPEIIQIEGYSNFNFKVKCPKAKYVLKIYPCTKFYNDWTDAENKLLLTLKNNNSNRFPIPLKTRKGKTFEADIENQRIFRVLHWLDGKFLFEVSHSPALFSSFGRFLAEMNIQMQGYHDYVIESRRSEWDIQHFPEVAAEKIENIKNPADRKIIEYFLMQYRQNILPEIHKLRKSVIHGDANDRNVLTENNEISGIIDFGDMCYSQLINETAIAIAYAVMGKDNPVEWACHIIESYHRVLP